MRQDKVLFLTNNPSYTQKDLLHIEKALKKSAIYRDFEEIERSHLRLHIDSDDEEFFNIHIGSVDPYAGGSGANYKVSKHDEKVILLSVEDIAPIPFKE